MIRVFLIDDHAIVRDGLRVLIDAEPDMRVVGETDHGRGIVDQLREANPDVAILDISLPDISGVHAAAVLRQELPRLKILALTRLGARAYVQQMLAAGASGYVLKQTAASVLIAGIRAVAGGERFIDPAVAARMTPESSASGRSLHADLLTPREKEVGTMVALGHSNKEIATALGIAVKTVESHKTNLMQRLGISSRAELVRLALAHGWLDGAEPSADLG